MLPFSSAVQVKHITTAATNTIFGNATVATGICFGITINKATTGAITIEDTDGTTTVIIAIIAASTPAATYWYHAPISRGLVVINASTEDFTVLYMANS